MTPFPLYPHHGMYTAQGLWYTKETADMVRSILTAAYTTLNASGTPFFLSQFGPEEQTVLPSTRDPMIRPKVKDVATLTFQQEHCAKYTLCNGDMLLWYTSSDATTHYVAMTPEQVALCFTETAPMTRQVLCRDALRADIRESFPEYDVFSAAVSHGIEAYQFIDVLAPWYDRTTGIQHIYLDLVESLDVSDLGILVAMLPTHSTKYNKALKYHFHFWNNKDSICAVDSAFIDTAYTQLSLLPTYRKDLIEGCTFVDAEDTTQQELYQYACNRWVIFTSYRCNLL